YDRAYVLAHVADEPPDPDADLFGWMLSTFKRGPRDVAAEKTIFLHRIGPELLQTQNTGLLELCVDFAKARGLTQEASYCSHKIYEADTTRARELFRSGVRAGAQGQFKEAAALLKQAEDLRPGNRDAQSLRLQALVESGDRAGLAEQLDDLRFHG